MNTNDANSVAPVYYNLDNGPKYASIYKVKFNSDLIYVYVEFYSTCPSLDEFTNAGDKSIKTFLTAELIIFVLKIVKLKCKIDGNSDIIIKDDKGCTIPDSITFVYFMLNTYAQQSFEIFVKEKPSVVEPMPVVVEAPLNDLNDSFTPIYENPDKFFVYFLSNVRPLFEANGTDIGFKLIYL